MKPPSFLILMGPYSIVPLRALAPPRATQIVGMAKSKEGTGWLEWEGGRGGVVGGGLKEGCKRTFTIK